MCVVCVCVRVLLTGIVFHSECHVTATSWCGCWHEASGDGNRAAAECVRERTLAHVFVLITRANDCKY